MVAPEYEYSTAHGRHLRNERRHGAKIAVLPIGSFEQHGDHLPLTTDTVVASLIAQRIATDYDLFLLPPITLPRSHRA
ncbi:creatininase family protein [Kitasatospora sp. NPDC101157]|uniref:creatininase family protein n=1 Tax=Kitasatospora sp. NPDC101157 TaxID=3364098 RepID=UPI003823B066